MTNDEFYNRINQVCKQTGLTKTEIAKRCGFDRKVLMKKGEILMGVYNFARFCEVTHADANWILGLKKERFNMEKDFMDCVKDAKWIPASERLPEKNDRYLVTRGTKKAGPLHNRVYVANYSDLMGIRNEKIFWIGNVGKSDFEQLDDVVAWYSQPIPKAYRESEA